MIRVSLSACFLWFGLALLGLGAFGCGTGSEDNGCQDGDFRPCSCSDGSIGNQACLDLTWSECQCQASCEDGATQGCVCTDGSSGAQTCSGDAWSTCECSQPECSDGQTQACTCTDGSPGAQTCALGSWGVCECAPPACQTGETRACNCPDGSMGSQTCSNDNWGACECIQPDCQTGEQKACTCQDGLSGSQTCSDGNWGACECSVDCLEGETQPCSCQDGLSGEQACQDGLWADCQCEQVGPVDLRGTFASLNVASSFSESIIGEVNATTVIISRMEFEQSGSDLVSTGKICTIELDSGTSFLTTIFPDSFIEALTVEPRPAHLEETEDGIRFVGSQGTELRGVHLDDPTSDPLPSEADDPRIWDQDGDGKPGLTVIVEGIIDGEMSIIQRDISSMTGEVDGPDRIEGLLAFENQMVIIEATNDLLFQGNDYANWQDPVAENSYLIFQRIDPSWTCQEILAERESLFE